MKLKVFAAAILPFIASAAIADDRDWSGLITAIEENTEDALTIPPAPGTTVSSGVDCRISDSDVDALDDDLLLTASESDDSIALHGPWGLPTTSGDYPLLVHREYLILHDEIMRQPALAQYRLTRSDVRRRTRETCFREDERIADDNRGTLADYDEPIFERGHLIPRADMNRSRNVMINTFLLSNIMPQQPDFNGGVWKTLESLIRTWARSKGDIIVVTGPIYDFDGDGARDNDVDRVRPNDRVGIPSHFFKVVLHERPSGFIETIAVRLPHSGAEVPEGLDFDEELDIIEDALVSIDDIEAQTGFDLFPDMEAAKQRAVERSIAPGIWHDD